MDDFDFRSVLGAIPLFSETLNDRQLDALAARCRLAVFPPGAFLMAEGDFAEAMFAIIDGEVDVSFHDSHGEEHGVATLRPGDIVGEMALMTGQRRAATVRAASEVVAVEITKATIEAMFARAPELIDRFGAVLSRRQAELDRLSADAESGHEAITARIRRFFGGR